MQKLVKMNVLVTKEQKARLDALRQKRGIAAAYLIRTLLTEHFKKGRAA